MKNTCRIALLLLAAVLSVKPLPAQEVFSPGPAKFITRFGFEQLTGGVIILKAGLDDFSDSLNFILDTGSGGISLDSSTALRLGLKRVPSDRTIKGIAGIRKVDFTNNHQLKLPGLSVDSLNFHINDYELLTGVYGVKIDGIVGYSLLRRYLLSINYDTKIIEVFAPGEFHYGKGGYLLRPAISGLPMQYAYVGDNKASVTRFFLDTGAGLNLLLNEDFLADSAITKAGKKMYPTVAEGLGGKTNMNIAVLKAFKLGPYKFRKVPVYIFADDYNVTSYPYLSGLIGNDLLRRFNVVINYPRGEIHLTPNTHYREAFDYSYTGLGLFSENNQIVISDVIPKSPAAHAGLKPGDVLLAVDNNLSNNMQAYKAAMQEAGKRLKLLIMRNNELLQLTLTTVRLKA